MLIFFTLILLLIINGTNKNSFIKLLILQLILSTFGIGVKYKKTLLKKQNINKTK